MSVRRTHNRVKEKDFFSKDINETIKKAKRYYAGEHQFYIFQLGDSYHTDRSTLLSNNPIKHFVNQSKFGERSKWVEQLQIERSWRK